MNRKTFLKYLGAGVLATYAPTRILAQPPESHTTITILSTNDTHSRIDPFPSGMGRLSNRGGYARRATLVRALRAKHKNVLLLDAGDYFQGTPYFNFYGGELEIKLMSMLQYDGATLGNHEFDNGVASLADKLSKAKFDILCANYDVRHTPLDGLTKPYKIMVFDNVRVGIFGLGIELNGLVENKLFGEIKYENPVEVARSTVRILREQERCDIVLCLSHLGYRYGREMHKISDVKLARETHGIDVIIGGHTHTFLTQPVVEKNRMGADVLISQVGWGGVLLGRVDISVNKRTKAKTISAATNYDVVESDIFA